MDYSYGVILSLASKEGTISMGLKTCTLKMAQAKARIWP
jgi:hypothetical protein